jgi:carboxypeptidase family protein
VRLIITSALLLALVLARPAAAQEQRGAIEGTVQDAQRGVLPGATVEALNLAQGASVSTTADATGTFRFPALAPGYYDVTASLPGFNALKFERVEVLLGQIKRLSVVLEIAGVTEEVRVSNSSPLVDTRQTARGFSLRQDAIDLLPKGRDFTTLVSQAPGANQEPKLGGISIDGSSAAENRFVVNGVETTNLLTGVSGHAVLPEFVDEIQVKSSGYTAEYGGSTGGVINVVTKSGTNRWRGDVLANIEGDALDGGRRPTLRRVPTDSTRAEYVTYPEDTYSRIEPGFAVGGPLKRDRAWLFAAYQPALTHTNRTVTFTFDGSTATRASDQVDHFVNINQTTQVHDRLRTRATLNWSPSRQNGMLPALDGATYPQGNFDIIDRSQNYTASVSADWVVTPRLFLGTRAGYFTTNRTTANVTEQPLFTFLRTNIGYLDVPSSLQQVVGFQTDLSNDVSQVDRLSRVNAQVDATYFGSLAGQHTLKAGLQFDRRSNDVDKGQSANRVNLFWNAAILGQRGRYGYYRVFSNPIDSRRGSITFGNVSDTTVGVFVQDAWTVHRRLTVNLGLRTENETVPFYSPVGATGVQPIHFSFRDKLAPRAGAAWDVAGDGRWKVHGSWGVFYDIFKLTLPQAAFGGGQFMLYSFKLETYDWPSLVSSPDCPPACPGGEARPPIRFDPSFENLDPDLDPMRLQEVTVGVEHQVSPHLAVSARFVHKQLDKAVEDIGSVDADGNPTYVIGNPGYLRATEAIPGVPYPKAVRDYDGVELVGRKLLDRNWALTTSYVWSRLYGNYSGLSESDENGRTEPNIGLTFDSALALFGGDGQPLYGRLATDRPHQAKAQLVYTAPFGVNVGVFQSVASGLPVSRSAVLSPGIGPVFYAGRGSEGRTPVLSQTDLSVQYVVALSGRKRLTLGLNVLNLFNQAQGVSRHSVENDQNALVEIDEADYYAGRADVSAAFDRQQVPRDPRFLQYQFFQQPIRARVGVRFSF